MRTLAIAAVLAVLLPACASDDAPSGELDPDLAGTWEQNLFFVMAYANYTQPNRFEGYIIFFGICEVYVTSTVTTDPIGTLDYGAPTVTGTDGCQDSLEVEAFADDKVATYAVEGDQLTITNPDASQETYLRWDGDFSQFPVGPVVPFDLGIRSFQGLRFRTRLPRRRAAMATLRGPAAGAVTGQARTSQTAMNGPPCEGFGRGRGRDGQLAICSNGAVS